MGMKEPRTRKIYNVQSYFYDQLAGSMIRRRQCSAISRMSIQPGEKVLDIGIGTGVSLEQYPRHCHVVGIDISEGMLGKARERIVNEDLKHASLVRADAMFMPFDDQTFDHILISHVITVVSNPQRLLEHIKRVGKPNCRIVIINHFQSGYRGIAWLEKILSPICVHLGWRSDLNLHELLAESQLEINFRYKIRSFDVWEIVFLRNTAPKLANCSLARRPVAPIGRTWSGKSPTHVLPAR